MAEERHQALQAHAGVGELGGIGVPQGVWNYVQSLAVGAEKAGGARRLRRPLRILRPK